MKSLPKYIIRLGRALILVLFAASLALIPAHADVAPPESPPGVLISPGVETTQVRMLSEVVTLTVFSGSQEEKAKTEAVFVMRNLGSVEEKMAVRFPLTYDSAIYSTDLYPEIKDFRVTVDGVPVSTSRSTTKDQYSDTQIPWANFPVIFPPGKDVNISVSYTAQGFGYTPSLISIGSGFGVGPFLYFRYILETGAAWKDTIGSGDIIVRLPYDAGPQNVAIDPTRGFDQAAGAPAWSGNEVRWHFENLEPTPQQNFEAALISPSFWQKVLVERQNTSRNPNDGEAWGRLGKALKDADRYAKGFLREDEGGKSLYPEAVQAYEKAIALRPNNPLWHYEYADLLWSHCYYSIYFSGSQDYTELTRLTAELKTSLQLDPANQNARDLANWISGELPWALTQGEQGYDFLILTVTPTYIPPAATETLTPKPTFTPPPMMPATEVVATDAIPAGMALPVKTPVSGAPPCGGAVLMLPFLACLFWVFLKRR